MHIIIAGATPVAIKLAQQLKESHSVIIVDEHKNDCDFCRAKTGCETIQGSLRESGTLEAAGISHAHAFFSTLDDDSRGLAACIVAKKFKVAKVVSILNDPSSADAFGIAGVPAIGIHSGNLAMSAKKLARLLT